MGRGGREWRWLPAGIDRTAEGEKQGGASEHEEETVY